MSKTKRCEGSLILKINKERLSMSKWIDINKKEPKADCIVCLEEPMLGLTIHTASYAKGKLVTVGGCFYFDAPKVTHWMPMPLPPKPTKKGSYKKAEEFKKQAIKIGLKRWDIHECSLCGYQCGYVFSNGNVFYDGGCDCTSRSDYQQRSWDNVAEHYDMQISSSIIESYKTFWGFV